MNKNANTHPAPDFSPPEAPAITTEQETPQWWRELTPNMRVGFVIALIVALGYLIGALSPVLAPFLMAAGLSYVGVRLVDLLHRRGLSRSVGTLLTMLLLIGCISGLFLIVVPMLVTEISRIGGKLPDLLNRIQTAWLPWVNEHFGFSIKLDLSQLKVFAADNADALGNISAQLAGSLKVGGQAVLGVLVNLILVPVVMFYLLRDWPNMIRGIDALIPRSMRPTVRELAHDIDRVLSEFLHGQALVMLALATYYCIALSFAGLEFALPVGLVTGLLVFIPYVGFGLGFLLGTLAALTQFTTLGPIIAVAGVFGVGQILEGFVLTPYFVGERIGLPPLAVIFALMAFGQLFGFVGILLALPMSAALLVAIRILRRNMSAHPPHSPAA